MSRSVQFAVTCAVFHLAVTALCVCAARRWMSAARSSVASRLALGVAAGASLLLAIGVLAAACSLIGPRSGFTVLRLVSQALFAEILALAVFVAVLEWRQSRVLGSVATALVLTLLACYAEGYHLGPRRLKVGHHSLELATSREQRVLRILHMSDLQADRIAAHERRAVEEAFRLRPDIVVWTGDYVHPRLTPTRRETGRHLRALLGTRPLARLGDFAVGGDVDVDWPAVMAGTGVVTLTDQSARVPLPGGRTLRLVGLAPGTSRGRDRAALDRAIGTVDPAELTIVAGHQPNFALLLPPSTGVDLVLAGHTHGGQVSLPLIGAPYTKMSLPRRYARGLHWLTGVPIHVSAGVGMEGGTAPQVRFLCPPEICVVEVRY